MICLLPIRLVNVSNIGRDHIKRIIQDWIFMKSLFWDYLSAQQITLLLSSRLHRIRALAASIRVSDFVKVFSSFRISHLIGSHPETPRFRYDITKTWSNGNSLSVSSRWNIAWWTIKSADQYYLCDCWAVWWRNSLSRKQCWVKSIK